ncbi:MAG: hypothetical protein HY880_05965 [Deltaproteobacteria bacterium]|nr:hypothetical protein [Deltaproteobacteria bacterium]
MAETGLQPGLKMMGLVPVMNNAEMMEQERIYAEAIGAARRTSENTASALSTYIREAWEDAKRAKQPIELRMLDSLRAVQGKYSSEKLGAIKSVGSSEIYMMITAQKCRDAIAWVLDIFQPAGDRPWTIDPTPIPELPPDVDGRIKAGVHNLVYNAALIYSKQTGNPIQSQEYNSIASSFYDELVDRTKAMLTEEAKKASERMAAKIEDQLVEGNWRNSFRQVIADIVRYPAGIFKAPVLRKKKILKRQKDSATGTWTIDAKEAIVVEFDRCSPWMIYPCSDTNDINSGDMIERHRLSRKDLNELLGVPGYKEDEIRKALNEYGRGGLKEWLWMDTERMELENRNPYAYQGSKRIDALQYWGSVPGAMLLEWGMDASQVPDPDLDYNIEAWLVGTHVIKAVINPHILGHKPYFKTSLEPEAGAFWGRGIPEMIADIQGACNATARAIINNMAIASGPQVEVNRDKIQPGTNIEKLWAWKVWVSKDNQMMNAAPAVRFFQPQMMVDQLMAVYEKFKREADDMTVPSYAHGDAKVGGAGNTASGLSMLLSQASKTFKGVVWNIDVDIIEGLISALYIHNMIYDADESIKGDLRVKARGSSSLMAKEQLALRRKEFLAETNNPVDMQIMGMEGRRALLKENVKSMDMPVDKIIPELPAPSMGGAPSHQGQLPSVQGGQQAQIEKGRQTDNAGNPVGGQDSALFNNPAA